MKFHGDGDLGKKNIEMEETKLKDPDKKNSGGNQIERPRQETHRDGGNQMHEEEGDLGRLFLPCFGLVFLLWNSSVSLSSMKIECETLDFLWYNANRIFFFKITKSPKQFH